jgi:hypothetical protein
VVLAERKEADWPLNHLAEAAVRPATTLGLEDGHELGIAVVAGGRVEHGTQKSVRCLGGGGRGELEAKRAKDFSDIALKQPPLFIRNKAAHRLHRWMRVGIDMIQIKRHRSPSLAKVRSDRVNSGSGNGCRANKQ